LQYGAKKICSFCGESIPRSANRCPYCASILEVTVDDEFFSFDHEQDQNTAKSNDVPPGTGETRYGDPDSGQAWQSGYGTGSDQQGQTGGQTGYQNQGPGTGRPYRPGYEQPVMYNSGKTPLGNGMKVFLTLVFALLPGIGQLAGIITAIAFMSSSDDRDRRSFGSALLVANIIMFVLMCLGCFVLMLLGRSIY
jgi:hypothetical protein